MDIKNIKNREVVIIGSGISGIAAARLLCEEQARVTLYDAKDTGNTEELQRLVGYPVHIVLGAFLEELYKAELLVLSPGVPTDIPVVEEFKRRGATIWGEVELAYRFAKEIGRAHV